MNDGRIVTRATYSTPCAVCRQPMAIGSLIELRAGARRWMHAECASGETAPHLPGWDTTVAACRLWPAPAPWSNWSS
jgi:hypothetical protein